MRVRLLGLRCLCSVHRHFFEAFGHALFKLTMAMERAEGRTTFVGVIKLDFSTRGQKLQPKRLISLDYFGLPGEG
jgi:hypothetical protein